MTNLRLKNIEKANFRANPNYQLILFDQLPYEQQVVLQNLQQDPDFYGVLHPRPGVGLGLKSVGQDTALLLFTLQEPGSLPSYVKAKYGGQCNQAIAELVLDGVLEIEWKESFISGSEAYAALYGDAPLFETEGFTAKLSLDALKYAQALEIDNVTYLSARLYSYNRLPLSPYWQRKFPTPEAVAEYLGIQNGGSNRLMLDQHWSKVLSNSNDGWLIWQSRYQRRIAQKSDLTYKLYLSPDGNFISDAFQAALEVFSTLRAPSFKIGKDVYGLLRSDKIVAYFASFEELQEAIAHLKHRLAGCPAQGVPFTGGLDDTGLFSWGIDPPHSEQTGIWQMRESWRLWVTNRLATALVSAKAAQASTIEPWQFALERLRLEGVDTATWAPTKRMWREDVEGEE